ALGRSPRRVCIRELETGRRRSARYGFGAPSSHNSSVSRRHQRLREYFVACARRTRVRAALDAGRRRLLTIRSARLLRYEWSIVLPALPPPTSPRAYATRSRAAV